MFVQICSLISDLNAEFMDAFYRAGTPDDGYPELLTLTTNGDSFLVQFMGSYIYDNENYGDLTVDDLETIIRERVKTFKTAFAFL
jgi:hypothetical protein